MRQITEWLAKIGLERYTPAFIDNDVDIEVLRYLTNADLEKIGVSLGHRRKLLAAIAELGGNAATPAQPPSELNKQKAAERHEPTPPPAALAPPSPFASAEVAGERRYLTVMFCDPGRNCDAMDWGGITLSLWLAPVGALRRGFRECKR